MSRTDSQGTLATYKTAPGTPTPRGMTPAPTTPALIGTPATLALPLPPASIPNPFADPPSRDPALPSEQQPQEQLNFNEIEVIRRPFAPSRPDELRVSLADNVKVLQIFDDGWAAVEKILGMAEGVKGQTEMDPDELRTGLIPVDCFRPPGQDLSSFFSDKRVSSLMYDESISDALSYVAM